MPDSLVNIVKSHLAQINLPVGYIVNVFDCASNGVVYGFEISPNYKEIVPCLGREHNQWAVTPFKLLLLIFNQRKISAGTIPYLYLV